MILLFPSRELHKPLTPRVQPHACSTTYLEHTQMRIDRKNLSFDFLQIVIHIGQQIELIQDQYLPRSEHLWIFSWLVISLSYAHDHHAQIFSQLPGCGTNQVADVLDDEQFDLRQLNFRERVEDHMRLQMARSPRVDLHRRRARRFNALCVSAVLDIALDHANAQFVAQICDTALQQRGLASSW